MAAPKKFSNGCQSDNFDPRRSAYGPFESLCPKFSETHAGKVSIFKIVGARPLRSQVIRKSCRPKRCVIYVTSETFPFKFSYLQQKTFLLTGLIYVILKQLKEFRTCICFLAT